MASRGRSFNEAVATDNWSLPPLHFEMIPAGCRYWSSSRIAAQRRRSGQGRFFEN